MSNRRPARADGAPSSQSTKRIVFRVLGVLLMGVALVLIGLAVADLLAGSDGFGAQPTRFWMFFAALPFFLLGGLFLQLGFSGAAATYVAGEYVPVLKDSLDRLVSAATRLHQPSRTAVPADGRTTPTHASATAAAPR